MQQAEFTENQAKILEHFVTNTTGNVFVLRNLPEVIKGALFSRYSRSTLDLKTLLLKEFILNEDTAFASIVGKFDTDQAGQTMAIQKAQSFYDRILDGYGDDSIGELGGAHLAVENISMLAAKVIEDSRIGGSPLEKSTRYVYFDQKVDGEYLFYREPVLMTSATLSSSSGTATMRASSRAVWPFKYLRAASGSLITSSVARLKTCRIFRAVSGCSATNAVVMSPAPA